MWYAYAHLARPYFPPRGPQHVARLQLWMWLPLPLGASLEPAGGRSSPREYKQWEVDRKPAMPRKPTSLSPHNKLSAALRIRGLPPARRRTRAPALAGLSPFAYDSLDSNYPRPASQGLVTTKSHCIAADGRNVLVSLLCPDGVGPRFRGALRAQELQVRTGCWSVQCGWRWCIRKVHRTGNTTLEARQLARDY